MSTGRLDIISCGTGFPQDQTERLAAADMVFGSRALLEACPVPLHATRVIAAQARDNAAEALERCRAGQRIVALASGDALYHGFGGTLAEMAGPDDPLFFHPGITAFQALFHRLGLPWQDARLFCAHNEAIPLRAIAESPLAAVYAGNRFPAHAIARELVRFHPAAADRRAVMAERLGAPDERLCRGTLAELAETPCGPTSILLLLPQPAAGAAPILPLGLPETDYARENNLITASDVRAVILSRLRLPAWGVLWDIGAGSGSVGLEATALRPGLRVYGVERSEGRCGDIRTNTLRLGVTNYRLQQGEAPACLADLPDPDRVFIGGGGAALPALLEACMNRLAPRGVMAASCVTLESFHRLYGWSPSRRTGLIRIDVATEEPIARTSRHLRPGNSIHLFTFEKEA